MSVLRPFTRVLCQRNSAYIQSYSSVPTSSFLNLSHLKPNYRPAHLSLQSQIRYFAIQSNSQTVSSIRENNPTGSVLSSPVSGTSSTTASSNTSGAGAATDAGSSSGSGSGSSSDGGPKTSYFKSDSWTKLVGTIGALANWSIPLAGITHMLSTKDPATTIDPSLTLCHSINSNITEYYTTYSRINYIR